MVLHNERGAISGAEGCMFFAMFLFAVLLVGLLVIAFFRFREPPQNLPIGGPPPTGMLIPSASPLVRAIAPRPRGMDDWPWTTASHG
jgi:hypothetical protein